MPERKQSEWPPVKRNPVADFAVPAGYFRTGRPVSGPLRLGTTPGVGPAGLIMDGSSSDFGMDRTTPRGFDPLGSHNTRQPPQEGSTLLSRSVRGRDKPGE
jgi:hypothetical protein